MDRHKYIENCMYLLTDPIKTLESKVQRLLRKLKSKKLYPTVSCPGKFYGTGKLHKLLVNGKTDHLPIRPIVPNIKQPHMS